ncbi:MAG: CCA tRNA nucleotidyltransferase [Sneathiella sp.]|nr:CCA tRNA nucleotidyltransferase [Sneathiella sp.]
MRKLVDLTTFPPPWLSYPESLTLFSELELAGGQTRFVGGCVRDALLGQVSDDLDVCTDLPPETVLDILSKAGLKVIPTGLKHGTVTALIGEHKYEITTLRVDVQSFGRHADVAFTKSWLEDAARRDFTINALYMEISGALHDYHGGMSDLENGIVQFIGDADIRIKEDYLRVLRFFRFYGRYGTGAPDSRSFGACANASDKLGDLSAERISRELLQVLGATDPIKALAQMQNAGILNALLIDEISLSTLEEMLKLPIVTDPVNRLSALLGGRVELVKKISRKLRLSAKAEKRLVLMCRECVPPDLNLLAQKSRLYKMGAQAFKDQVLLSWSQRPEGNGFVAYIELADSWAIPQCPVSGKDLLKIGIVAGPGLGIILKQIEEVWIESDFTISQSDLLSQVALGDP